MNRRKEINMFLKCILIFLLVVQMKNDLIGQIPNSGFENWTDSGFFGIFTPNDWRGVIYNFERTSDCYSGTYALLGKGYWNRTFYTDPRISANFPIAERPNKLVGFLKYYTNDGDTLFISSKLLQKGKTIGTGSLLIINNIDEYTRFEVDYIYTDINIPDSCEISFENKNKTAPYHLRGETKFHLDDISFSTTTSIKSEDIDLGRIVYHGNYPNPFNSETVLRLSVSRSEEVSIEIINLLGQVVSKYYTGILDKGIYNLKYNLSGFNSGMYFLVITTSNYSITSKIMLLK